MTKCLLVLFSLFPLSSCIDRGKQEVETLKTLGSEQASFHLEDGERFKVFRAGKYRFLAVRGDSGIVFIMLNPKASPWYKQTPRVASYALSQDDLRRILGSAGLVDETVVEVLHSHVRKEP